jgi:hypothetical protein
MSLGTQDAADGYVWVVSRRTARRPREQAGGRITEVKPVLARFHGKLIRS